MTTLHTVEVSVHPEDALKILRAREQRSGVEGWQLVASPDSWHGPASSFAFDVWVDGCDTGEVIVLQADGTWGMTTHVVMGDALPQGGTP